MTLTKINTVEASLPRLTQHPARSRAVPLAGLKVLQLFLTSGSGSQSFENYEGIKYTDPDF